MSLIYLTPKVLPAGHVFYAVVNTDTNSWDLTDSLVDQYDFRDFKPTGCWGIDVNSLEELINRSDLISFTRESHPEYFI